jgi:hypothetical protein
VLRLGAEIGGGVLVGRRTAQRTASDHQGEALAGGLLDPAGCDALDGGIGVRRIGPDSWDF